MTRVSFWLLIPCILSCFSSQSPGIAEEGQPVGSRTFRFNYCAKLTELPPGSKVRVWVPVPTATDNQRIEMIDADLPAAAKLNQEPVYGNRMLFFETKAPADGSISFCVPYHVTRFEVRALQARRAVQLSDEEKQLFLKPNRKVPVSGLPVELLSGVTAADSALGLSRAIYERVDDHVRYDKSRPGYGNGDVLWVCDSKYGNCTDFHSLFIALSRARKIPARFEIGFQLPPERGAGKIGGYHCWAFFHNDERGWVPVDISEADKRPEMKDYFFGNLTEDRVTFSVGRDLNLTPRQSAPPLNFFIYPHVEVNDKPLPTDRLQLAFSYVDQ